VPNDSDSTDLIPLFRPSYGPEEVDAVKSVLESGWVGLGPVTSKFEEEFARYIGTSHSVALNSGTAALHLAMCALDLKNGDEVLVSPLTFVSTVHVVMYQGATPVFVDIEEDTLNMSVEDIKNKLTGRTKAIVPVDYGGQPCDSDAINQIAEDSGLQVVEDAAHACGATYRGRKVGTISDITCFSFHAVKNLACGEGGALTFKDDSLDKYFRQMRWLGIARDTWTRTLTGATYAWQYSVDKMGYKYHMHDISAAIGLAQLRKLDANNLKRRQLTQDYNERLRDLDWLELPIERDYANSSWHIFHIKLRDQKTRDALIEHLKRDRISPGVHYYPVHLYEFYRKFKASVPRAEEIWKRILSLPLFPDLTDTQFERIIASLHKFKPP
jgi:perosamine synthetase